MNKFCVFWRARTAAANCSYLEFNSYTTQIYAAAKFDAKIIKLIFTGRCPWRRHASSLLKAPMENWRPITFTKYKHFQIVSNFLIKNYKTVHKQHALLI